MFGKVMAMQSDDTLVKIDYQILEILEQVKVSVQTHMKQDLSAADIKNSEKQLLHAKQTLNKLISLYESSKLDKIKKQDAPLSLTLVPCTDRVQIEKAQLAKDLKLQKLERMNDSDLSGSDSISFENDVGELSDLDQYPIVHSYTQSIFSLSDMYCYRGVINCYLQKYDRAIDDF